MKHAGGALRVGFDRSIKLEFHRAKVGSDGEWVTYRDLGETLQVPAGAKEKLTDFRTADSTLHDLVALLGQTVLSRLAGYEDTNDVDRLRVDPTTRRAPKAGGGARRHTGDDEGWEFTLNQPPARVTAVTSGP